MIVVTSLKEKASYYDWNLTKTQWRVIPVLENPGIFYLESQEIPKFEIAKGSIHNVFSVNPHIDIFYRKSPHYIGGLDNHVDSPTSIRKYNPMDLLEV